MQKKLWIFTTLKSSHLPGFHGELVGLVGDAALQAGSMNTNTCWVAAFSDANMERALGDWRAVVAHFHTVWA